MSLATTSMVTSACATLPTVGSRGPVDMGGGETIICTPWDPSYATTTYGFEGFAVPADTTVRITEVSAVGARHLDVEESVILVQDETEGLVGIGPGWPSATIDPSRWARRVVLPGTVEGGERGRRVNVVVHLSSVENGASLERLAMTYESDGMEFHDLSSTRAEFRSRCV